jgi:hypothetical protein
MSFTYRVNIYQQDGTLKGTYTPSDPFSQLGEIGIDRGGSCGDAQLSLLQSGVSVALRDILEIETSDDGTTFTPLYLGTVVQVPNARTDELDVVRCVGLKQRLYEAACSTEMLFSDDVASMFATAMTDHPSTAPTPALPAGVTFSSGDAPATGFTAGDRYPKYESLGALADALAGFVGSFVVPTATTYTYDGVTFNAGDLVPGVVWGVNAAGELFFRRPVGAPLAVDEGDVDTRIEWLPVEAEQFVNRVNVIYASAYDLRLFNRVWITGTAGTGNQFAPDPLPIVRTFSAAGVTDETAAEYNAVTDDPLAIMTQSAALGYDTFVAWTNPSNMVDNNPSTFAQKNGGGAVEFKLETFSSATTGIGDGFGQGIFILEYASTAPVDFEMTVVTNVINQNTIFYGTLPATGDLGLVERVGLLVATQKQVALENLPQGLSSEIYFETTGDIRIHRAQAFRPDVDAGATRDRRFAESFFTVPRSNASTVSVTGIEPLADEVVITPLVGSAVTARIERVGYSISTGEGAQTVYYVDQAFAANEEAQRVVLERLARRAVREGGQA